MLLQFGHSLGRDRQAGWLSAGAGCRAARLKGAEGLQANLTPSVMLTTSFDSTPNGHMARFHAGCCEIETLRRGTDFFREETNMQTTQQSVTSKTHCIQCLPQQALFHLVASEKSDEVCMTLQRMFQGRRCVSSWDSYRLKCLETSAILALTYLASFFKNACILLKRREGDGTEEASNKQAAV